MIPIDIREAFQFVYHIAMTSALALQFTSVRTRVVDGKTLIGLKHTAKDAEGARASTDWVEMPPEDVERLVKKSSFARTCFGLRARGERRRAAAATFGWFFFARRSHPQKIHSTNKEITQNVLTEKYTHRVIHPSQQQTRYAEVARWVARHRTASQAP